MKNYRFQSVIAFSLLIGVTCSCQKEKNFNPNKHDIASSPGVTSMIILGNQLQNPYSVQNMVKAQNNLNSSKRSREGIDDIEISTTHLYVKFLPRNDEELSILKRDTSLILFTYPMDYEIAKEGDYYHDPSVPQN